MRLIFIRHGDPDYQNDNLTPKGKREAELLTKRICTWDNITAFFSSPLGRAQATGLPAMKELGREFEVFDWLQEFHWKTRYPDDFFVKELAGKETMCWDFIPQVYYSNPDFFDKDKWCKNDFMKAGNIDKKYEELCAGIDGLLSRYGYDRNNLGYYDVKNPVHNPNFDPQYNALDKGGIGGTGKEKYQLVSQKHLKEDCTLVFFCHLGVMFAIIAHLTGLSPVQMWQNFYVAPTSLTILNTEERIRGQAMFRVERLGDTKHLADGGEPASSSGYFTDLFDK